jgi:hypothetical protein
MAAALTSRTTKRASAPKRSAATSAGRFDWLARIDTRLAADQILDPAADAGDLGLAVRGGGDFGPHPALLAAARADAFGDLRAQRGDRIGRGADGGESRFPSRPCQS